MKKFCIYSFALGISLLIAGGIIVGIFSDGLDLDNVTDLNFGNGDNYITTSTEHTIMEESADGSYNEDNDNGIYRSYTADSGLNLDINMASAEIYIESSKSDNVEVTSYNVTVNNFTSGMDGNTLTIRYSTINDYFNVSEETAKPIITISIPTNISLGTADISLTSGSICLSDVTAEKLDVSSVAAWMTLNNVTVGTSSDISVTSSSVGFYNSILCNTSITSTAGGITADDNTCLLGTTEIETVTGDIYLNLSGDPDSYGYEISNTIGNYEINGSKSIPRGIGGTDNSIKINQTTGECTINFE
jgi:hypothetical protein